MGAIPGANQLGPGSSGVSWPVSDETFKVADNADATKIVEFELMGMTTANTIPIRLTGTAAAPGMGLGATDLWSVTAAANTTYNIAANAHLFEVAGAGKLAVTAGGNVNAGSTGWLGWASGSPSLSSMDTGLARSAAGVIRATGTGAQIRGFLGGGAAVASAAALPLPTGRVFHVTGTTTITSITSTDFESGAVITLIFDGVLTFTDGSNLVLAGNFVTTANDTITLVYDGTSWFETSRSVN